MSADDTKAQFFYLLYLLNWAKLDQFDNLAQINTLLLWLLGRSSIMFSARLTADFASFQNRSYWDSSALFWITKNMSQLILCRVCTNWLDEEGIIIIMIHTQQLQLEQQQQHR
jgi:hypothetical protein